MIMRTIVKTEIIKNENNNNIDKLSEVGLVAC